MLIITIIIVIIIVSKIKITYIECFVADISYISCIIIFSKSLWRNREPHFVVEETKTKMVVESRSVFLFICFCI